MLRKKRDFKYFKTINRSDEFLFYQIVLSVHFENFYEEHKKQNDVKKWMLDKVLKKYASPLNNKEQEIIKRSSCKYKKVKEFIADLEPVDNP